MIIFDYTMLSVVNRITFLYPDPVFEPHIHWLCQIGFTPFSNNTVDTRTRMDHLTYSLDKGLLRQRLDCFHFKPIKYQLPVKVSSFSFQVDFFDVFLFQEWFKHYLRAFRCFLIRLLKLVRFQLNHLFRCPLSCISFCFNQPGCLVTLFVFSFSLFLFLRLDSVSIRYR